MSEILTEYTNLAERYKIIDNAIQQKTGYVSIEEYKEKCRKIFTTGGIIEKVLGADFDEALLVGCLLAAKDLKEGGENYIRLKEKGRQYLQNK